MAKGKDKELRFEDAIVELEALIEKIESGETGLEECLAHYERGTRLIVSCQGVLASAQKRIAELTADDKGRLSIKSEAGDDAEADSGLAGEDSDAEAGDQNPIPE